MAVNFPPIVAGDSMTRVWGVRGEGTNEQRRNAKWMFDQFTARKTQVVIAAITVAEYLAPVDAANHKAVIEILRKRFLIQPFTIDCAALSAELFVRGKPMRKGGVRGGRAILKADTMIIATARVHGAVCIYTNDSECRDLANTISPNFGRDVPVPTLDMFGNPTVE